MLPPTFFDDKNTIATGSRLGCGIYSFTNNSTSPTPRGVSGTSCNGLPYTAIALRGQTRNTLCVVDGSLVPQQDVVINGRISDCTD
jgi:hypothetical protein